MKNFKNSIYLNFCVWFEQHQFIMATIPQVQLIILVVATKLTVTKFLFPKFWDPEFLIFNPDFFRRSRVPKKSIISENIANIFLFFAHKIKTHSFLNVSSIDMCEGSNVSKRESNYTQSKWIEHVDMKWLRRKSTIIKMVFFFPCLENCSLHILNDWITNYVIRSEYKCDISQFPMQNSPYSFFLLRRLKECA